MQQFCPVREYNDCDLETDKQDKQDKLQLILGIKVVVYKSSPHDYKSVVFELQGLKVLEDCVRFLFKDLSTKINVSMFHFLADICLNSQSLNFFIYVH